jgi:flagellar basal-body rod protein FlgB
MSINSIVDDNAMVAAKLALEGLSAKGQAISQNIANVDTPGYKASTVNFQDAVKQAMNHSNRLALKKTEPGHLDAPSSISALKSVARAGGSERADENNVDINVEMSDLSVTGLQYETMSTLVSKKLVLLKAIAAAAR